MADAKQWVKLRSGDGFEFIVDREAACVSNTIKSMLDSEGNFQETTEGAVTFPDIPAQVLEKVCQYFYYKLKHANTTSKNVPEFPVNPEMALELLMAANYLDC